MDHCLGGSHSRYGRQSPLTNAAACSLVPRSPRWLLLKGLTGQARQTALVMMIITVPATLMCDMCGRRTSSLVGGSLTFFFMLLIRSLYAAGKAYGHHGAARWVVIVSVYL